MQVTGIRALFAKLGRQGQQTQGSLPAYSPLTTSPKGVAGFPIDAGNISEDSSFDGYQSSNQKSAPVARFSGLISHFTLGFADGLTVPFALTAGLSSLGQTRTVIYAGIAEICAGCISMGIGGYLAAKGETTTAGRGYDEKSDPAGQDVIQKYIALLDLPPDLLLRVKAHIDRSPAILQQLSCHVNSTTDSPKRRFSPAVIGLSVSIGYMLGGLLPLFPYFFVNEVNDGLQWSFAVCLLALFFFGFAKDYLLNGCSMRVGWQPGDVIGETSRWGGIKQAWWEGMRMVIMGGIAAAAAVLCVGLFEHIML